MTKQVQWVIQVVYILLAFYLMARLVANYGRESLESEQYVAAEKFLMHIQTTTPLCNIISGKIDFRTTHHSVSKDNLNCAKNMADHSVRCDAFSKNAQFILKSLRIVQDRQKWAWGGDEAIPRGIMPFGFVVAVGAFLLLLFKALFQEEIQQESHPDEQPNVRLALPAAPEPAAPVPRQPVDALPGSLPQCLNVMSSLFTCFGQFLLHASEKPLLFIHLVVGCMVVLACCYQATVFVPTRQVSEGASSLNYHVRMALDKVGSFFCASMHHATYDSVRQSTEVDLFTQVYSILQRTDQEAVDAAAAWQQARYNVQLLDKHHKGCYKEKPVLSVPRMAADVVAYFWPDSQTEANSDLRDLRRERKRKDSRMSKVKRRLKRTAHNRRIDNSTDQTLTKVTKLQERVEGWKTKHGQKKKKGEKTHGEKATWTVAEAFQVAVMAAVGVGGSLLLAAAVSCVSDWSA